MIQFQYDLTGRDSPPRPEFHEQFYVCLEHS